MASTICWICSSRPAKTALWLTGIAGVKTDVSLARRDSASAGGAGLPGGVFSALVAAASGDGESGGGTGSGPVMGRRGSPKSSLRRPEDDFDQAEADAVAFL